MTLTYTFITLPPGLCIFHATRRVIVSLSDYKPVVIVINKSNLLLTAIIEQSELFTLPIRQIMSHWHKYDMPNIGISGQSVGEVANRTYNHSNTIA